MKQQSRLKQFGSSPLESSLQGTNYAGCLPAGEGDKTTTSTPSVSVLERIVVKQNAAAGVGVIWTFYNSTAAAGVARDPACG